MSLSDLQAGRRPLLVGDVNPNIRLDYLVTLSAQTEAGTIRLRYVPDRLVLAPGAFAAYAARLGDVSSAPERLGVTVLDDVNNEIVPRWIEVTVEASGVGRHAVTVTDQQPNWSNPSLMVRLGALS